MSIREQARKVIADVMRLPVEDIEDDKSFDDLDGDSLDAIETIMALEVELDITLDETADGVSMTSTIGELLNMVEKQHVEH